LVQEDKTGGFKRSLAEVTALTSPALPDEFISWFKKGNNSSLSQVGPDANLIFGLLRFGLVVATWLKNQTWAIAL